MTWLDELFGMTPNAVGAASAANEPVVSKYRAANGSFDPNAIAGIGPAELADETRMRVNYANAAREMLPPEEKLTWNRAIGNVLSAASVPVAYAQGNTQYGSAMTGNTLADQWNARRDANTDARKKAEYGLGAGVLSDASDAASSYYGSKRKRRTEAVDTVAKMIAMSNKDPEAIKEGAAYLRTLGLTDDASYVESMASQSAPVAPVTPAPMTPAPGSAEAMGDTLPNLAGGLAQSMPPADQAAAMASADPATAYQMPAEIQALYNRATRAEMLGTGNAAALMKQADAAADIWKKKEAARFSSRDGAYSVQPTVLRKNGKLILGQIGPSGEVIETKLPEGAEYYDPVELAASKEFGKKSGGEQGEAQAKAATSLPGLQSEADYVTKTIDQLLASPGRKNLTGKMFGGTVWSETVPDYYEETGDARALHEQIRSNAFLMAFEKLKGAGAITEAEGQAATAALARLTNLQVSDAAYEEALKDFQSRIQKFVDVARSKASARVSVPGSTPAPTPNYETLDDDEIVKRLSGG